MKSFEYFVRAFMAMVEKAIEIASYIISNPDAALACVGVLLLIAILLFALKIRAYFQPIKLFDNNSGVVEVTRKALDSLVQSVCYNLGALNKPSIKIITKRGRLSVFVSLKIESNQKLVDISSRLQEELSKAFREQLGVEKLGSINVKISGFRGLLSKPLTSYEKSSLSTQTPKETFSGDAEKSADTQI